MDQFALDVVWRVGTTSLFMALSIAVAIFALRLLKCHSPSLQCFVWSACLIQGVLLTPFVMDRPAKTPDQFDFPIQLLTVSQQEPAKIVVASDVVDTTELTSISSANSLSQPIALRREYWAVLILGLWLGGIAFLVGRWIASYVVFVGRTDIQPCDQAVWNHELSEIKNSLSIRKPIDLFVSDDIGPALCRYPRGYRVVVPQSTWNQFSSVQRQSILTHELAHFKRKDIWRNLVGQMIATLHWFNPLAWYALRQLELASELACDDIASRKNSDNITSYATALLEIGSQSASPLPLASSAAQSSIALRIRRLVDASIVRDSIWKRAAVVVMLLPLILVQLVRFEANAQEPLANASGEEKGKVLKVSDAEFNNAAEYLRSLKGFVQTFHDRTSKDHWVEIQLQGATFDEKVIDALIDLSLDAKTELSLIDTRSGFYFYNGGQTEDRLTTISADALAKLHDTRVTSLSLDGAFVTDELIESLANWENLQSLSIGTSKLTHNGLKRIATFKQINSLSFRYSKSFQGSDFGQAGIIEKLESLYIHSLRPPKELEFLAHAKHLKSLQVTLDDEEASRILMNSPCIASLEQLHLFGEGINEQLLATLSTNAKKLSQLRFGFVKNLTPKSIKSIMSMNQLTHLGFQQCNVDDNDIKPLSSFERLQWLCLLECPITDEGLSAIGKIQSLKSLMLMQTEITNNGVPQLLPLSSLEELYMNNTKVSSLPEEFRSRKNLVVQYDGSR